MKYLLMISLAVVLWSQPARAENKEAARAAYAEGHRFYALNQFDDALAAFKRAYLNYEDPVFLYNIAQCHRQLGHRKDAIQFYRSYLQNSSNPPNADDVRASIKTLEADEAQAREEERAAALARQQRDAAPQQSQLALTAAPPAPPPRTPVYKKWWLWTIVGVAAAGAATGIALAVTSQRTEGAFMNVTVTR